MHFLGALEVPLGFSAVQSQKSHPGKPNLKFVMSWQTGIREEALCLAFNSYMQAAFTIQWFAHMGAERRFSENNFKKLRRHMPGLRSKIFY